MRRLAAKKKTARTFLEGSGVRRPFFRSLPAPFQQNWEIIETNPSAMNSDEFKRRPD